MPGRKQITGVSVHGTVRSPLRETMDLAGRWKLKVDPRDQGMAEQWAATPLASDLTVPVPGCIQRVDDLAETYPPGHGPHNGYLGTAWMERAFALGQVASANRTWLKFGGIGPAAHVWLNGRYVGYHGHGLVAVKWDVTDLVQPGAENHATVAIIEQDAGLLGGMRFEDLMWSGLYRTVEIEMTHAAHIEEVYLQPNVETERLRISARIHNDGQAAVSLIPHLEVTTWRDGNTVAKQTADALTVAAGGVEAISFEVAVPGIRLWTTDDPFLHVAALSVETDAAPLDAVATRFGMRAFGAAGVGLHLNGRPFMARGTGGEYFSPTISPLTERPIIEGRYLALKDLGFNFHRCHTYVPTDEELDAADEIGLLLSTEVSVVSNFNRVTPFDEGLVELREHIVQTRNHPSVGVYCLGNETSQLYIFSELERERARRGYAAIKEAAPDTPAMIGFGVQGERPELPNDIESPHLWSDHFTWAYDGLADVPWRFLAPLLAQRPCIMHEYGKYTVWPDPAADELYRRAGLLETPGRQGRTLLEEAGLGQLEPRVLANSRRLAWLCHRIAIEQARRQPGVDGYTLWSGWRVGGACMGFVDDLGLRPDFDPELIRKTCNAAVAILIDRDFEGRTLRCGEVVEIELTISNFGDADIENAGIAWRLEADGQALAEGRLDPVACPLGQNRPVGRVRFHVPWREGAARAVLSARLDTGAETIAGNRWDFWIFPLARGRFDAPLVYDIEDPLFARRLHHALPGSARLIDFDSVIRGCRVWTGTDLEDDLKRFPRAVLISERWTDRVELWLREGGNVLLLDTERLPEPWYPQPTGEGEPARCDQNRLFAPFRTGWDQGNAATIVGDHPALGDFPHEGFCDLQFFAMIQGSRPLNTAPIRALRQDAAHTVIVRNVAKVGPGRHWDSDTRAGDRAYLMEVAIDTGRLLVCSFQCINDPAGLYLLEQLLRYLRRP